MSVEQKQLNLKKHQRQAVRLNAQKELKKADSFFAADAAINRESLDLSIKKLEGYRSRLNTLDEAILISYDDPDQAEAEFTQASQLDETLFEAIERLGARLRSLDLQPADNSNTSHVSSGAERHSVKLPKLEIPHFRGDALKWQEFWDSFTNSIHDNDDLSAVEKFTYLKSFLSGDALRVVEGYRLTSANFEAVVKALQQRFGNKQIAIFSHFESMLALPVSSHELSQLQAVYDDCEKHIRSLVALGLSEDTFGQVFTPIVLSKLPKFVKMELHRRNSSEPWTLSKLRQLLKDEIYARDMSQRSFGATSGDAEKEAAPKSAIKSPSERQFQTKRPPRTQMTTASLVSAEKKPRCAYCGDGHHSDQCRKYADVSTRRKQMTGHCLSCLSTGHSMKECRNKRKCAYCGGDNHHRSLCFKKFGSDRGQSSRSPNTALTADGTNVNAPEFAPETGTASLLSHGERTVLQTAVTSVAGSTDTRSARLLLDTGCSRSFVTTRLCKQIGARYKGVEIISMAGFADTRRKSTKYKIYEFDVVLKNGQRTTLTANAIDAITCPVQIAAIDASKHPIVNHIPLAEPLTPVSTIGDVDILVGGDYYYDFVGSEQIKCSSGLVFLSSSLGYIAAGRIEVDHLRASGDTSLLLTRADPLPESNFDLERFWRLEDIGVSDKPDSKDDDSALSEFNSTVRFEDGRYSVKWPWKPGPPKLDDNRTLAKGRLKSLTKRLADSPDLLAKYDQTIQDQISKGVIELAPSIPDGDLTYYIPHHHVITPQKSTTKLRVVYDASSKSSAAENSLNDCIHRGPVMLADLCGLLLRFRIHQVALVSDIEKAFLQVALQKPDRDVTRFFWFKDASLPLSDSNIVVYRFCRVPFGVLASPFLLAATVAHHLSQVDSPVSKEILNNLYVDNVVTGKNSISDALSFYAEAKSVFKGASMNLREWFCNDPDVVANIADVDRGSGDSTKVLGIRWNLQSDTLSCSVGQFDPEMNRTKRGFMKALASVFDPCGFFAPLVVVGKILLQEIWKQKYKWDESLPTDLLRQAKSFLTDLRCVPSFALPRRYFSGSTTDAAHELHCFVDASAKAYCAAVYLRTAIGHQISSTLIFAKCRVSPLKELTIPKLELMAILVGTRILSFAESQLQLPITRKILWSDSQCALHWVLGRDVSTTFVRNRVNQIRCSAGVHFRYVPTDQNPADHPTRGLSFSALTETLCWWNGPPWLLLDAANWPTTLKLDQSVPPVGQPAQDCILTGSEPASEPMFLIESGRYSTLAKLLRVTCWVRRFVHNAQRHPQRNGPLSSVEITEARSYWDKAAQQTLLSDCASAEQSALVKQLGVRADTNGLLRCCGRLGNADIPDSAKNPILLPSHGHWYSKLVIQDVHSRLAHAGVKHTLAQLRLRYWIASGRREIKRVINSCAVCRRIVGGAFQTPPAPHLPDFRTCAKRVFSCVGIDYLGPLYIRNGQTQQKVWLCLFTCAAVRAVHLEVVEDLSASPFVLCLRRFMATYGVPQIVVSDNAKQFHSANKLFVKLWKELCGSEIVQDLAADRGIVWKFITEKAPWMGGFYERMIGVVKQALKKSLDRRRLSLTELQTVVAEIASIVNSRPLVYLETEVGDTALTPAHFLLKNHEPFPEVPDGETEYVPRQTGTDRLIRNWKRIQALLNSFWTMWRRHYLLGLRETWRSKQQRGSSELTPQVNTTVLIDDGTPRSQWRIGRIVRLVNSRDGFCRSVHVRMANGNVLCRPVKSLYPLAECDSFECTSTDTGVAKSRHANASIATRTRRAAAVAARDRIAAAVRDSESESEHC